MEGSERLMIGAVIALCISIGFLMLSCWLASFIPLFAKFLWLFIIITVVVCIFAMVKVITSIVGDIKNMRKK